MIDGVHTQSNLEPAEGTVEELPRLAGDVRRIRVAGATYRLRWVKCGRHWCSSCPHGPYWYRDINRGGKTVRKYIGKDLLAHLALRWMTGIWIDQGQPDLPGMPDRQHAAEIDRPAWMPAEIYDEVRRVGMFGAKMRAEAKRELEARLAERREKKTNETK